MTAPASGKRKRDGDSSDPGRDTGTYAYRPAPKHYKANKKQVKYGPGQGLSDDQKQEVVDHLYPAGSRPAANKSVAKARLTQYHPKHQTYVDEARKAKRPRTLQEHEAERDGANASGASINHIIASGVGQNTVNRGIADTVAGRRIFDENVDSALAGSGQTGVSGRTVEQERVLGALARQAAAVGRVQMYNRAIAGERADNLGDEAKLAAERNRLLQTTLTTMQGTRGTWAVGGAGKRVTAGADRDESPFDAYRALLKETFDSPANLRVGHSGLNTVISTGFDMELDAHGDPTPRGRRLYEAHQAAAPDHDEEIFTTFADGGERLSSSMQVDSE